MVAVRRPYPSHIPAAAQNISAGEATAARADPGTGTVRVRYDAMVTGSMDGPRRIYLLLGNSFPCVGRACLVVRVKICRTSHRMLD